MRVIVRSRYGLCSRGKHWAMSVPDGNWAEKWSGSIILTVGRWRVGSDDGYSRKDRADVTVHESGEVDGLPYGWSAKVED